MPPHAQRPQRRRTMRLFRFQSGRFRHLPLPDTGESAMHQVDVEDLIRQNIHTDGTISSLCLDFCGSYVALQHEDEIRLAARLLCTYHNSLLPRGPGASLHGSPPVGPVACSYDTQEKFDLLATPGDEGWSTAISRFGGRRRSSQPELQKRWHKLAAAGPANSTNSTNSKKVDEFGLPYNDPAVEGHSDSDDEKDKNERLQWEYEVNADVDGTPNFGKAKMENHLW